MTLKGSTMKRTLVLSTLAVASTLALAACGEATDATTDATTSATSTATTTAETTETTRAATEEDREISADHNDADIMFAQMMIPHHQQAIEMSDIILAKDDVPGQVVELAEEIKAAQGPEIEQLTTWLGQWGEPTQPEDTHGGHDMSEMEGMLSEQELQELANAPGPEAARLFLEQMITHHEGAVAMAETEVADGTYPPAVDLARSIIDTQQQEIDTMRQMLDTM